MLVLISQICSFPGDDTSLVCGEFRRYLVLYSGVTLARYAFPQDSRNFSQLEPVLAPFMGVGGITLGG